jgi:alkylation response protein AidB-like acyl-CoA dehydrogenase
VDFAESIEQREFRLKARAWIERNISDLPHRNPISQQEREVNSRWWQERMYADGWAGMSWPVEFGGKGMTPTEDSIFNAESALVDAPLPINLVGMNLAGPTIMVHGNDHQKKRYLNRILSGQEIWCQGFSEPGSGSDLASLSTKAERVEGGWKVNGQKVWTSSGHLAQKCMLLTRTNSEVPKHKGITYLLADTKDFDIRPLVMVNRDAEFNEMFINDVFVSDDDLLGTPGEGWRYALSTLSFERGTIGYNLQVWARRAMDKLVRITQELGLHDDAAVQEQLGRFEAEVEAIRITGIRAMASVSQGAAPGPESSILKILWARTVQQINRYSIELRTTAGVLVDDEQAGDVVHHYLRSRGHSIEGGSDEIMKSIIAERVLGMPKSR